jgi:membrane protein implicated in regulation of membrane protease activity
MNRLRSTPIEYRIWLIVIGVAALVFLALGDYFLWWVSVACFAALAGRTWLWHWRQSRPHTRRRGF